MMMATNTPEKAVLKPFTLTPTNGQVKESPGKNGVAFDVLIKPPTKSEKVINKRKSESTQLNEKVLEDKLKSAEARRKSIQEKNREALMSKIEKVNADKENFEEKMRMEKEKLNTKLENKMALAELAREQELLKKKKEMLLHEEKLRRARANKIRDELQENKAELTQMHKGEK